MRIGVGEPVVVGRGGVQDFVDGGLLVAWQLVRLQLPGGEQKRHRQQQGLLAAEGRRCAAHEVSPGLSNLIEVYRIAASIA
jgi:hypothetical protein